MKIKKIYLIRVRAFVIIFLLLFMAVSLIKMFFGFFTTDNRQVESVTSGNINIQTLSPPFIEFKRKVRSGTTIEKILYDENINANEREIIINAVTKVFDVRKIKIGNEYVVRYNGSGLGSIKYFINYSSFLLIKNKKGKFSADVINIPIKTKLSVIKGVIEESLFQTILRLGEKGELADLMASLFEYDVDFNRDIRQNDSFTVLIEKKYVQNKFVGYGHLIAAKFVNRGKIIRTVRFEFQKGKYSYFHPDGKAVRKMFLRCPLPFMRVTSRFGLRKHPILGFSANHNGVDFGAPRGTVIRVSGDGVVFRTGYSRVRGRFIIISHKNNYKTHYYHLSGIKPGIRRGKYVVQGKIIGYVGSTGRSTGPHLHYGIQRGRRYINPLRLRSPSKSSVPKKRLKNFKIYSDVILTLMEGDNRSFLTKFLLHNIVKIAERSG